MEEVCRIDGNLAFIGPSLLAQGSISAQRESLGTLVDGEVKEGDGRNLWYRRGNLVFWRSSLSRLTLFCLWIWAGFPRRNNILEIPISMEKVRVEKDKPENREVFKS